jgi:hypothetical protein
LANLGNIPRLAEWLNHLHSRNIQSRAYVIRGRIYIPRKGRNPMHKLVTLRNVWLLLPLLGFFAALADAQAIPALESIKSQEELNKAVASLDAGLFDSYNRCDLNKFTEYFADDIEFYHDQGGVTLGRQALTDSVKKNICGKVTRELVPGTLQVYPMKGYGAVEIGVHRFHHPGHEDTEPVGEGKFIHLWQYKNGAWKITRVISYDHHAVAK